MLIFLEVRKSLQTMTAWGVKRLVKQGKLSLDTPIELYLKRWNFPDSEFNAKRVTVRRLLSHTAGLPSRYYSGLHANFSFIPEIVEGIAVTTNATNGSYVDSLIVYLWSKWMEADLQNQSCNKAKSVGIEMYSTIKSQGIEAAIKQYSELKKRKPNEYQFDDGQLNTLGYSLFCQNKNDDAIKILELNAAIFSCSEIVFDSLAEVYMYSGQKHLAIQNYEKVLYLNPNNDHAKNILVKLKAGL